MADAAYHSKPGLSFHQLMDFQVSPAFYYKKHVLKTIPRHHSAAMDFGTAVHMAVLEPDRFKQDYIIAPDEFLTAGGALADNKNSRAWSDSIKPKKPIAPKDHERILKMADSLFEHDAASAVLGAKGMRTEVEWFTNRNGIALKGCADIVVGESIYDLKTCKDLDEINESINMFHYAEQLAWYLWLFDFPIRSENAGLICVEVEEPYRVKCIRFTDARIEEAYHNNRYTWQKYQACKDSDSWPGQPFPGWTIIA